MSREVEGKGLIILRFRDFDTDTIKEHASQVALNGAVWWGWWRKAHEEFPEDALRAFRAELDEGPQPIGLIDRFDGRAYVAECDDLVGVNGEPVASPQRVQTPLYYREARLPSWFRLTTLRELELERWCEMFGPVPVGDETLFVRSVAVAELADISSSLEGAPPEPLEDEVVSDSRLQAELGAAFSKPEQGEVDAVDVRAPKRRGNKEARLPIATLESVAGLGQSGILHISDLHFGDDHAFTHPVDPLPVEGLIDVIASSLSRQPAALVVSGDLTTRYNLESMRSAFAFIERLADRLELGRSAVVIVPGNHDIRLDAPFTELTYSGETLFREMAAHFYDVRLRELDLERVHVIEVPGSQALVIGTLNSVRLRSRDTMEFGWVGRDRSAPLMAKVRDERARWGEDGAYSAVVMHHHVLPANDLERPEPERQVSMSLDAGELLWFAQEYGIDSVLHGHQHLPFVGAAIRHCQCSASGTELKSARAQEVRVLGAGSVGVVQDRLLPQLKENSFSEYLPHEGRLKVRTVGFRQGRDPRTIWDYVV